MKFLWPIFLTSIGISVSCLFEPVIYETILFALMKIFLIVSLIFWLISIEIISKRMKEILSIFDIFLYLLIEMDNLYTQRTFKERGIPLELYPPSSLAERRREIIFNKSFCTQKNYIYENILMKHSSFMSFYTILTLCHAPSYLKQIQSLIWMRKTFALQSYLWMILYQFILIPCP